MKKKTVSKINNENGLSPTEQTRIDDIVNRKLRFIDLIDREFSRRPKKTESSEKKEVKRKAFVYGNSNNHLFKGKGNSDLRYQEPVHQYGRHRFH